MKMTLIKALIALAGIIFAGAAMFKW